MLLRDLLTRHDRHLLTACPVALLYALIRARQHSGRLPSSASAESAAPDFDVRREPAGDAGNTDVVAEDQVEEVRAEEESDSDSEGEAGDGAEQEETDVSNLLQQQPRHVVSKFRAIIAEALRLPVPGA